MYTPYLHATARAKILATTLPTATHFDELLSTPLPADLQKVFGGTTVAANLITGDENFPLSSALTHTLTDAKQLFNTITPEPQLLNILWLRYDFHNLKTLFKNRMAGITLEQAKKDCINAGSVSLGSLINALEEDSLYHLNPFFKEAVRRAEGANHVYEMDAAFDRSYLEALHKEADHTCHPFLTEYALLRVDLFNLLTALRLIMLPNLSGKELYIPGGTYQRKNLDNEQYIFKSFARLGGEKVWSVAFEAYRKGNSYILLERTADEYLQKFLQEKSITLDSPAPIFLYITTLEARIRTIYTIITARTAGFNTEDIRPLIRNI